MNKHAPIIAFVSSLREKARVFYIGNLFVCVHSQKQWFFQGDCKHLRDENPLLHYFVNKSIDCCQVYTTTFPFGHVYFAFCSTSTKPISSKFSEFYTDVFSYRKPFELASLLSHSVVKIYRYWFGAVTAVCEPYDLMKYCSFLKTDAEVLVLPCMCCVNSVQHSD